MIYSIKSSTPHRQAIPILTLKANDVNHKVVEGDPKLNSISPTSFLKASLKLKFHYLPFPAPRPYRSQYLDTSLPLKTYTLSNYYKINRTSIDYRRSLPSAKGANEILGKSSRLIKEPPTPTEYARPTRIWPPNSYFKLQTNGGGIAKLFLF